MDKGFRAIGFKNIQTPTQLNKLRREVITAPTEKNIASDVKEDNYIEYYKSYNENFGLTIKGSIDSDNHIIVHSFVPYAKSDAFINIDYISVEPGDDFNELYVVCDDIATDNELIFYLQNDREFFERDIDFHEQVSFTKASVCGLALSGTVILNVVKDEEIIEENYQEFLRMRDILNRARQGDNEAARQLDIEAEQNSQIIRERLQTEDFYSVIEAYMIPDENVPAKYSVLGEILAVKTHTNRKTAESVYAITVSALETPIDIYINSEDLVGIPLEGMRFKGECLLQGFIK